MSIFNPQFGTSGIRIRLQENFVSDGFYLFIRDKDYETGVIRFGEPVVMKPYEDLSLDPGPVVQIPRDNVQDLFDQLWNLGFRPRKYKEADGELKATKYHLEDTREAVKYFRDRLELIDEGL